MEKPQIGLCVNVRVYIQSLIVNKNGFLKKSPPEKNSSLMFTFFLLKLAEIIIIKKIIAKYKQKNEDFLYIFPVRIKTFHAIISV